MKEKILLFVVGVLVGSIIASGSFFVYTVANNSSKCDNQMQMPGGNPPGGQNGQPPEMQNGQNNQNGQPPEKPSN